MIGRQLNHYRIVDKLGEGGMAEVFLAEDTRLGRRVALKVLPPETARDPSRIRRFEREAKAIAALNHPNIVTIYSVEEAEGLRFLTMELIEGQLLSDLIPVDGMPLESFYTIALPLVGAVAAAHRRGVTHRDIKPANVMLNSEGVVKLLDLGLAKLESAAEPDETASSAATLTREGRAIGTVPYMAPEQLAGKTVDHRADIFGLGVVLYEMVTGRRPFVASSSAELISAILRDTPRQVSEINHELPAALDRTIRRCLAKRPEDRFQSADELRTALETASVATVVVEPRAESGETARAPAGEPRPARSRWMIGGGVALAVATLVAALITLLAGGETSGGAPGATPGGDVSATAMVLGPIIETGTPSGRPLAPDLERELRWFLGDIDGLVLVDVPHDALPTGELAATRVDARYTLHAGMAWSDERGGAPLSVEFQLERLADGDIVWSETFRPARPLEAGTLDDLAAVVRSRVGEMLGLQAPPAPPIEPFVRASSPPPSPRRERPPPVTAPTTPPVVEAIPTQPPGELQLLLSLTSRVPAGVVTVYAGTEQIYRRSFAFNERKGGVLGRVGLKKRVAGVLEDAMLVPADAPELRVYVAVAEQPARQFELTTRLRGDGTDRLLVDIRKEKAIEVALE